jgi:hypothetical protein
VVVVTDVAVLVVANGATVALVIHVLFDGGSDKVSLLLFLMLFAHFDANNY